MSEALIGERGAARWRRIGELLVLRGLSTQEEVASALAEQTRTGRRLGQILVDRGVISAAALDSTLAEQASELKPERGFGAGLRQAIGVQREQGVREQHHERPPLGQVLRRQGYVSDEDINRALSEQAKNGKLIGEILVEHGAVSEQVVSGALGAQADAEPETAGGLFTGLRAAIARNDLPDDLGRLRSEGTA
jgi:type IV pilus assembly protein PilB